MAVPEHDVEYLEIVTPDVEAVVRLYGETCGWRFEGPQAELGHARVARLPDGSRCGIRAPMHETEKSVVRIYVRVADLDAAVRRAEALGARILLESLEIPGQGRVAIYEAGGVEHGLWELP